MRMFASLYERAIVWARHRHAVRYLAGLSFVEAFIFPVMPEIMLAPMMLAEPRKAFRFANWSLLFSWRGCLQPRPLRLRGVEAATRLHAPAGTDPEGCRQSPAGHAGPFAGPVHR